MNVTIVLPPRHETFEQRCQRAYAAARDTFWQRAGVRSPVISPAERVAINLWAVMAFVPGHGQWVRVTFTRQHLTDAAPYSRDRIDRALASRSAPMQHEQGGTDT